MIKWLQSIKSSFSPSSEKEQSGQFSIELAVSVLLVEIMHADHEFDEREEKLVMRLLQDQYSLEAGEASKLYKQADQILNDAVSLHEYTSVLHAKLSYDEKFQLLIGLWGIALSDGDVDRYEEHLIRKIAELLYISHKDFIKAKHQAIEGAG